MENTQTKHSIRKIMEEVSAIEVLSEIKNKIGGIDLMDICNDETSMTQVDLKDDNTRLIIKAIQCGLVYWDENENCLVQKLINPIKCGEISASEFKYKNKITMKDLKLIDLQNPIELLEKTLAQVVARPLHLIGELHGQDMGIAVGCIGFFGK